MQEPKKYDDLEEKIFDFIDKLKNFKVSMERLDEKMMEMQLQRMGYSTQSVLSMQEVIKTEDPQLVWKYIKLCLHIHPKEQEQKNDQGGERDE